MHTVLCFCPAILWTARNELFMPKEVSFHHLAVMDNPTVKNQVTSESSGLDAAALCTIVSYWNVNEYSENISCDEMADGGQSFVEAKSCIIDEEDPFANNSTQLIMNIKMENVP